MSLYLPDQKLGSHSTGGGASNKFMLKGRQTGTMHRGHSWVFRAESYDTMMAWYEDIRKLTETSPQERSAFVRQHARSVSGTSQKPASISSDGVVDEDDEEPFSATAPAVVAAAEARQDTASKRPQAGGRFPSDIQVDAQRGLLVPLSPSSGSSGFGDANDQSVVAAAADLPGSGVGEHYPDQTRRSGSYGRDEMSPNRTSQLKHYAEEDGVNPYTSQPVQRQYPFKDPAIDTALGIAASAAAESAYRDDQAKNAPEVASGEANKGDQVQYYNLASREAAQISAPDIENLGHPTTGTATHVAAPDGGQGVSVVMNGSAMTPTSNDTTPPSTSQSDSGSSQLRPTTLIEAVRTGQHHESVQSISQLHVPGEYPIISTTN